MPARYHMSDGVQQALAMQYGTAADEIYCDDLITTAEIHNYYAVPATVANLFSEQFPGATYFHATSLQLEQLQGADTLMYCIVFGDTLKLILFKSGILQVVQQFSYIAPEDVLYHLLNMCEQHAVKPTEVLLRLTGMIDENSRLYTEIYKYFMQVVFEDVAAGIYSNDTARDFPPHYFSHLITMALCVS